MLFPEFLESLIGVIVGVILPVDFVIVGPLVPVGEHIIGLTDLVELLLSLFSVFSVLVGVPLGG